jgi:hypothetical protein
MYIVVSESPPQYSKALIAFDPKWAFEKEQCRILDSPVNAAGPALV